MHPLPYSQNIFGDAVTEAKENKACFIDFKKIDSKSYRNFIQLFDSDSEVEEDDENSIESDESTSSFDHTKYYNENELEEEEFLFHDNTITSSEPLNLAKTTHGNHKLCYEGFYYTIDTSVSKNLAKTIKWKCEFANKTKTRPKCNGRVETNGLFYPVKTITDHNHMPVPAKETVLKVKNDIVNKAKLTHDAPRSIIRSCQTAFDDEAACIMPRPKNLP